MDGAGATSAVADGTDRTSWVRMAARNNAEWCAAVCRAHGISGDFGDGVWTSARRTPPLYPDAVTLTERLAPPTSAKPGGELSGTARPGGPAPLADLLSRIDTASPGCSVKDSFACLDLAPAGFEVLLEAQWIHRPPQAPAPAPTQPSTNQIAWDVLTTPADLPAWTAAWGAEPGDCGPFRPELLTDDATTFLRARDADGQVVAGAVATVSTSVVGLSNVFTAPAASMYGYGPHHTWAACLTTVTAHWPGLPVVGYESGADLEAAVANGCRTVGPLRVWWRGA
ncbi:hypothetical protein [Streptomyces rimosus]|uniref:hypothetical protein n=1 Tax=Streptomyces rimosus TaxID=1927 RepID=UPI00067DDD28|nr:hypothetical protein [Streptomyces rimosus]